jgi:benzoyl-CoA reductase/2-hydroxyglutaryl-CoA dehydratase subunit BcrC/BadD/HgdB
MALDTAAAKDYLVYELNRCRASLEGLAGHAIPSEAITESIKLFNRSRSLLGQLYGLRRQRPSAFSLEEIAQVMAASQIMPKEEFIPMLEDYLREKQNTVVVQDDKVPIFLACNQCEDLEPGLPQMLDSMGALVVDDDLYFGYRYFANSVAETGDPIVALCQAHLDLPACPTRHHRGRDWSQFLLNRARAAAAKGVVLILQKFCEIHIVHYPRLLNEFQKANMPLIMLESNHSGASGLTKTRLEAFLEMLRE